MDIESLNILRQLFDIGTLFSKEEFLKRLKLWLILEGKDSDESAIYHYSERLLESTFIKKYYLFGGDQNKIKPMEKVCK